MMRSPKLIAASNGERSTIMSPRNVSRSSASWGWCLTVGSNMSVLARSGGRSTGMPWLSPITSVLQATPINTIAMPRNRTLRAQNAMISA